jgi:DNA-binding Xre family transcriptional regulator
VATDTEKNIAANIKTRMAIREVAVKELSVITEIPASTLYTITKAEAGVSFEKVERIAKALRCSVADLVADPVAIDRPDVPTAWRVLKGFMEALTPLKLELVEALAALDDAQVRRYLNAIRRETAAASGTDLVEPSAGVSSKRRKVP